MDRRTFIKGATTMLVGSIILPPSEIYASVNIINPKKYQKSLSMYNVHTDEILENIVFEENGFVIEDAIMQFNYLLRDRRTNEIADMDIDLLKRIFELEKNLNTKDIINVLSGYRSKKTNELLRKQSSGVAKHSMHLEGKAIDLNFPTRKLVDVKNVANKMKFGGVGYYPKSQFIHLDTGKVRHWKG